MLLHEFRLAFRRKEIYWIITLEIIFALIGVATTPNLEIVGYNRGNIYSAYQASLIFGHNTLFLLFVIAIPIIAALSYSDSYFAETKYGVANYILVRGRKKAGYFSSKAVVVSVVSFTLVVLPLLLNLAFCALVFEPGMYTYFTDSSPYEAMFFREYQQMDAPGMFIHHPLSLSLQRIAVAGFLGAVLALSAYNITLFFKNGKAAVIAAPLIFTVIWEMVSAFTTPAVAPSNALVIYHYQQIPSQTPFLIVLSLLFAANAVLSAVRAQKRDEL